MRELCGVYKGMDERIDDSVLRRFGHSEWMGNYRSVKRVWLLEKRCLDDVEHTRKMLNDRNEWQRFVRGMLGMNPRLWEDTTAAACHSYMKPFVGRGLSVVKSATCGTLIGKISFLCNIASLILSVLSWNHAWWPNRCRKLVMYVK